MDSETLWWTWGMAGRHTEPITSQLIYSNYRLWNDTIDQETFNTTGSNSTWIAAGNSTTSTTLTTDHDIIITIAIAAILGLEFIDAIKLSAQVRQNKTLKHRDSCDIIVEGIKFNITK
ncbi:hypothetical protein PV327_009251 [Microctonus hyperodae]|uniref:Uncharacterized protein n=1 Tax=Microctonus hyperodae TaxID=165561 RepID=A0AA39FUG0_MICHY|nr:hypothetical protein PV327_009251 [Microctonus hyperodae]